MDPESNKMPVPPTPAAALAAVEFFQGVSAGATPARVAHITTEISSDTSSLQEPSKRQLLRSKIRAASMAMQIHDQLHDHPENSRRPNDPSN